MTLKTKNYFIKMEKFNYILDKIKKATFIPEPFEHLLIDDLFSEEHFNLILNDEQIHFNECSNNKELRDKLNLNNFTPIQFPGCTTNEDLYFKLLDEGNLSQIQTEGDAEGVGIAYNLRDTKSQFIKELLSFLNGHSFHQTLMDKFNITDSTRVTTRIQKYLTGYEISPHPDIRQKSLTYLLNINKNKESESLDMHTHLLKLKKPYNFIYDYWKNNPKENRAWVSWDWCDITKTVTKNNSLIIFKPNNYSLHAVKLNYDHLKQQRTQIYGNLMFSNPPQYVPQNISKFYKILESNGK
jgi:hypothetical protein